MPLISMKNLDKKGINGPIDKIYNLEVLKQNIKEVCLTQKTTRLCSSISYGTRLEELLFNPNDSYLISDIETEIKEAVALFEPRVNIQRIVVDTTQNEIVNVSIYFNSIYNPSVLADVSFEIST